MNLSVFYIRNEQNQPVAAIAVRQHSRMGSFRVAGASCSRKDNFTKTKARMKLGYRLDANCKVRKNHCDEFASSELKGYSLSGLLSWLRMIHPKHGKHIADAARQSEERWQRFLGYVTNPEHFA